MEMPEKSPSDNCRLCNISFKVKFGNVASNQSHSSSENLFKPSKRKDCFGVVLANICRQVGLELTQDSQVFSDRVCNPCGHKIRNLGQLYQFVKTGTSKTASTPSESSGKRDLDTPEKASPSWRKSKVVRVNSPAAKTPLLPGSSTATIFFLQYYNHYYPDANNKVLKPSKIDLNPSGRK